MTVGVMITSRNRADELAITLQALRRLDPRPAEILITLDGCTDHSAELLRTHFPEACVIINEQSAGSIPSRDRMMRLATSDLVLSLDDDSHPIELDFLPRAAAFFIEPHLAVLTFPQRSEEFPSSLVATNFGGDRLIGSYSSSGAILRRSTYLQTCGYAAVFRHAYEEPDYTLQCIAAGGQVRLHTGLTIRHFYSGRNRDERRIHQLHARNEQWSILLRCPSPWWPLLVIRRAVGQFIYACRRGARWVKGEPTWWWATLRDVNRVWRARSPVPWAAYRRWLKLLRQPEALSDR